MKNFYNPDQKTDGIIVDQILSGGHMRPDGKLQDIMEVSTDPNYDLGTRLMIDDRVYRYAKAFEALAANRGAFCNPRGYWEGNGSMPLTTAANLKKKVIFFDNKTGIIGKSALKDGWVVGVADSDPKSVYCMKIKDNELSNGAGGVEPKTCELTLYRDLPYAITAGGHTSYVYANIYSALKQKGGATAATNLGAVVCVPPRNIAGDEYFWGQTWGIYYCLCGTYGNQIGKTVNKRIIGFDGIGAAVYRPGNLAGDAHWQPAGYLLMDGTEDALGVITNGDQLAMLTISP